jgi:hypothetical protein
VINGWTEQHPSAVERLNAGHPYVADGRRVARSFRVQYKWLRQEMRERLPGYGGRTPIWMIAKPNHQRRRLCDWSCQTDLGYLCSRIHITPGKTWMRIRLPAERVLLSDFDRWDNVIRGEYVAENEEDACDWDEHVRRTFQIGEYDFIPGLETGWPTPLLKDIVRSWTRVFDTSRATTIQGAFEHLTLADVTDLVEGPDPDDTSSYWQDFTNRT